MHGFWLGIRLPVMQHSGSLGSLIKYKGTLHDN